MPAPSLTVLHNIATQLRIDSVRSTTRRRLRPSDDVSVGGRDHGGAVLRGDAFRSAGPTSPRSRSLRVVERPRGADPVRGLGRGGRVSARGSAEAPEDRLRSRGSSDAAAAVRGRRHRIARPGSLRRRRHGAQRAAHRLRLPDVRAPRRRRERRGRHLGIRADRRVPSPRQPVRDYRRQRLRPEPRDAVGPRTRRVHQRGGRRSAGMPSPSMATTSRRF